MQFDFQQFQYKFDNSFPFFQLNLLRIIMCFTSVVGMVSPGPWRCSDILLVLPCCVGHGVKVWRVKPWLSASLILITQNQHFRITIRPEEKVPPPPATNWWYLSLNQARVNQQPPACHEGQLVDNFSIGFQFLSSAQVLLVLCSRAFWSL